MSAATATPSAATAAPQTFEIRPFSGAVGAEIIEESYNYFDDVTHCLKANTSPHLAEQKYGHRDFVTGTVGQLIRGDLHIATDKPLIYSPFGMGILDLAIGRMIHDIAVKEGSAVAIPSFFGEERRW